MAEIDRLSYRERGRSAMNAFRLGAVDGICATLTAAQKEEEAAPGAAGAAMVLASRAAQAEVYAYKVFSLRERRADISYIDESGASARGAERLVASSARTMTTRSRYDELHDKFDAFRTEKPGTRYERLAAIVLKALHEQDTVIHDLKLVGNSEVKHQIDIIVEAHGKPRRILVECKDFDVSGDPVGLAILRDFFAVVEDTKPDEAIILTCNGFTEDARRYAKAKGIRLAVLQLPRDDDWRRHPRTMEGAVSLRIPSLLGMKLIYVGDERTLAPELAAEREAAGMHPTMTTRLDPVFIEGTEDGRVHINDYLTKHLNARALLGLMPGVHEVTIPLKGMTLEVARRGPHLLHSMIMTIRIQDTASEIVRVTADTIAALILMDAENSDAESVVWEDDLLRYAVDDDGEVRERVGATKKPPP